MRKSYAKVIQIRENIIYININFMFVMSYCRFHRQFAAFAANCRF